LSVAESNIGQSNVVFDHVLAYALGNSGTTSEVHVESMLASGNSIYIETHQRVQEMLGHLPSVLAPVVPPPFLKDKVMSQISASQIHNVADKAPVSGLKFVKSFSLLKRSAVFAGLLIGGIFVSAYTVEQILDHNGSALRTQQVAQANSANQYFDYRAATRSTVEQHMTEAAPIEAPQAVLSDESDGGNDLASKQVVEGASGHMQTNFGLTQAYINLTSEASAQQYQLAPSSANFNGVGRILWDESHGDALLVVSKLQPNNANSHYVLWYMHDGGTPERMLNFNAASPAAMSFFINRAPGARVSGVMITLERSANGRLESQSVLQASAREHVRL
jgi:hypothetical protein